MLFDGFVPMVATIQCNLQGLRNIQTEISSKKKYHYGTTYKGLGMESHGALDFTYCSERESPRESNLRRSTPTQISPTHSVQPPHCALLELLLDLQMWYSSWIRQRILYLHHEGYPKLWRNLKLPGWLALGTSLLSKHSVSHAKRWYAGSMETFNVKIKLTTYVSETAESSRGILN